MGHGPTAYGIQVATEADLTNYPAKFDDGDIAYVIADDDAFVYEPGSSETPAVGVVIDGPGGVGRWILQARHVYGALYCHAGNTPQSLSAVPALLTCWNGATPSYLTTLDLPNDQIVIQKPGAYQVSLSLSGTSSGNQTYNFHVYKNGQPVAGAGITRVGSQNIPIGGTTITFVECAAGDVIAAYGDVSANTPTITIIEASLAVVRMG